MTAAAPDLEVIGKMADRARGARSLRWVLVHMVEEHARHCSHADLLRKRIDAKIGQ